MTVKQGIVSCKKNPEPRLEGIDDEVKMEDGEGGVKWRLGVRG